MAGSAVSAAASSLGRLACQEAVFLCGVHDEVELLREDLRSLQTFLSVAADAQRGSGGDALAEDSVRRIRDAAYDAENIIDTVDYRAKRNSRRKGLLGAMSRYAHKPADLVAIHRLGKDIRRVKRRMQEIKSNKEILDAIDAGGRVTARAQVLSAHRASLSRAAAAATGDDPMVGFEADLEQIVGWLKDSGSTQLTVVSIVAMGGAGKTTLARKVYNSAAVKEHFDAFAFVSISQQFELLRVLKEMAAQAMGIEREGKGFDKMGLSGQQVDLEKMGEQGLAEMLHSFLEGKRYLIVLDDVWRMDTWEAIQHALPDPRNGSRVMLTTRNSQVAKQANKLTHVHEVRLLNDEESWQLFSQKAFPSYENIDDSNRQELETVGKNLVKKCNGLPLALVVLGSHLSKNLLPDTWLRMDHSLDWEVTSKWDNMQRIIARSYDDLPSHYLKSCFLCMVSFPADSKIESGHLITLWIAEGFMPHRSNHTLEETALDCLEELAQRSMIQILYRNKIGGQIEYVQMHDIVREWALQHAREEGFLCVCKNHADASDAISVYRFSFLEFFDRGICISAPNMRSMLGFHLPSVTFGTLRFLRALHMSDSNLEKVSSVIGCLIHLRCIALICCKNVVLPSSIGRLLNLQSLDLTGTPIPYVPKSLWDIPTLRHVNIPDVETFNETFNFTTIRVEEQSNLQILNITTGVPKSPVRTQITRLIRLRRFLVHMTQLRFLGLVNYSYLPADVLTSLSNHHHLHWLCLLVWESMDVFPDSTLLPQNLRFLALGFPGPWNAWHADMLPTLGSLQSLRDLRLVALYRQDDADVPNTELTSERCRNADVPMYEAPIMSSPAGGFPKLWSLALEGVQSKKLRFQAGTMPKLIELCLRKGHMESVPDGLLELPSLKKLDLVEMVSELPRETHELLESKGIKVSVTRDE